MNGLFLLNIPGMLANYKVLPTPDGDVPIDNNWVENQIRPWDAPTGCLPDHCAVANGPQ
jgi:hypothetical protein